MHIIDLSQDIYQDMMVYPGHFKTAMMTEEEVGNALFSTLSMTTLSDADIDLSAGIVDPE